MNAAAERRLTWRHVVVPILLFAYVSAMVFTLAKLHPFSPDTSAAAPAGTVRLGDPSRGKVAFESACAGCHGADAEGGVGPALAGRGLEPAAVKTQIVNGGGTMPGNLVEGQELDDVLAYVARITQK
jgi:mono/diheme cytochrome c family protein